MSQEQQRIESILVADCGSAATKLVLIDLVEGQYRLIAATSAPGTVCYPWQDVSIGVKAAIESMQQITGRVLLDEQQELIVPEQENGQGVDCFLVVSSAATPLRVLLAGLVGDVSLASARRAALSTYTTLAGTVSLAQPTGSSASEQTSPTMSGQSDQIHTIWHSAADLICLVGGTDGGAANPVINMVKNVIRVALYLMGEAAPPVIYAGNARLRDQVVKLLEDLTTVQATANVRPLPDAENPGPAGEEIEVLFHNRCVGAIPGIQTLEGWSEMTVLPTARSSDYVTRFCERLWKSGKPALSLDVGSTNVTLNVCEQGRPLTTIRTDLGIGDSLRAMMDQVNMCDLVRWLPFEMAEIEARDRLMNRALRPHTIPQTREDLLLVQAAVRESLRLILRDSLPGWVGRLDQDEWMIPPCDPIIACGQALTGAPYPGHVILMLLDALQPSGINRLYLDEFNLMASLGIVGAVEPLAMVQTIRNGGLTFLGTAIVPVGHARAGETALAIKSKDKANPMQINVAWGSLEVIPAQACRSGVELELRPARGLDIGSGAGQETTLVYTGGTVGLVIDARGRPLEIARSPQSRIEQMGRWLWTMTGV